MSSPCTSLADHRLVRILVDNVIVVADDLARRQFVASLAMSGAMKKPDEHRDLLRTFWRDETNRMDVKYTCLKVPPKSKLGPSDVPLAVLMDVPWWDAMNKEMDDLFRCDEIDEARVLDIHARGVEFPDDVIDHVVNVKYEEGCGFWCSEKLVLILMDDADYKHPSNTTWSEKNTVYDIDRYRNGYDIPLAWFAVTAGYVDVLERILKGPKSARANGDGSACAQWMKQSENKAHAEDLLTAALTSGHDDVIRIKLCKILMRHGAQPHGVDEDGGFVTGLDSSAFMVAAELGDVAACTLFLQSGADPMATTQFTDDELETQEEERRFSRDMEIDDDNDYFIFGQDWRSRDVPSGSSPYTEAIREGRIDIVDLFDTWCLKKNPGRHIVRRAIARIFSDALCVYNNRRA
jgi:hypothetical protein